MAVVAVANVLSSGSGGEVPAITVFRDSFNRTSGGLGPNWFAGVEVHTAVAIPGDAQYGTARIAPITGGIQGLTMAAISIAGSTLFHYPLFAVPLKLGPVFSDLDPSISRGFTQFAELKMVHRANLNPAATLSSGPAVFLQIGDGSIGGPTEAAYYFEVTSNPSGPINPSNICRALAYADGMFRLICTGTHMIADGDIMRIVVTPSAGSNFVEIFLNGVSEASGTDSDASRPLYGMPGFFTAPFDDNLPVIQEFNNFIGGLGDGTGITF